MDKPILGNSQLGRYELFNKLQMMLAGEDIVTAIAAIADTLAVAALGASTTLQDALKLLDSLHPEIKRHAENNWDRVQEQRMKMAKGGAA